MASSTRACRTATGEAYIVEAPVRRLSPTHVSRVPQGEVPAPPPTTKAKAGPSPAQETGQRATREAMDYIILPSKEG